MRLKIYGSSDDLIEIEGDFREEFNVYEAGYLCFSDGTLLRIEYGDLGVWRIHPHRYGTASYVHTAGIPDDDEKYTDVVILEGEFTWISWAKEMYIIPKEKK